MKIMKIALAIVVSAAFGNVSRAAVSNGGFENTRELKPDSQQHQAMTAKNWTLDTPCIVPRGWTPNPYRTNCTYRLLSDPEEAHAGNHCISIDGDIYTGLGDVRQGQVVEASVWARGDTGTRAWIVLYAYGTDDGGKPLFLGDGLRIAVFTVTPDWARYSGKILVPPEVTRVSLALRGEGVFFDDADGAARVATAVEGATLPKGDPRLYSPPANQPGRRSDAEPLELSIGNAGFEEWRELTQTPRLWTLNDGQFPCGWTPENYKEIPSTAAQARGPAGSGGKYALFLRGQIVSGRVEGRGALRRKMAVSVRAKGAGGRLYVGLRAYGPASGDIEEFRFLSDLIDTPTTHTWRLYTGLVDLTTGPNAVYGRLQIEAEDVLVDDVRMRSIPVGSMRGGPMQLVLPPAHTSDMPRVDGQIAPGEWSASADLTGFANIDTHSLVSRQTYVSLTSDGQRLFLCFRSPTLGQPLRATVTERDGQVWTDDAVEIFVGRWPEQGDVPDMYQFIVNPKGAVFDARRVSGTGDSHTEWNCPGLAVATSIADGTWTTEVAIPFAEVGIEPGRSAQFGLQLCRDLTGPAEWSSLTGQGYRSLFQCRLQDDVPVVRWESIGDIRTGKLNVRMSVTNPHSEPKTLHAAIGLTGVLERNTEQKLTLPAGATANLVLRCADTQLDYGRFRLKVIDDSDAVLFHQSPLLDTRSFLGATTLGSGKVQVEFYPVQRKVNIRVRHVAEPERTHFAAADLTLYGGAEPLWSRRVERSLWVGDEAHFTVGFDEIGFEPVVGNAYTLKAALRAADGTVTEIAAADFEPREPPWVGNELGRDAKVIPPFEPIRVSGASLACWGRKHRLVPSGFPGAIESRGLDVLAGPILMVGERSDGVRVAATSDRSAVTFTSRAEHAVQFAATSRLDALKIRVAGLMEQDGMIRYELDLIPERPVALRRLSLEIPLAAATLLHCVRDRIRVNCEWLSLPEGDGVLWRSGQKENVRGIYGTFAPFVWVGNEKAGLCWFADNDRGWSQDGKSDCLDLVRTGGRTVLRVNIVAAPAAISGPRHIVFGLQATPVRPTPVAPPHRMVMNYFGFDNPIVRKYGMGLISKDLHLAEQILAPRKERGETAHVYMANDIMPVADPVAKTCYYEWALSSFNTYKGPLRQFGRRVNGLNRENYIGFFNGAVPSRIDYNLHCLNTLFGTSLSGLYLDNSYPKACTNVQHPACGYLRADGNLQGGYNLFGTRELVKRAAVLAYQSGGLRPHVSVHMTDAMVIPCFSFAGLCIDGEDRSQLSMDRDFMDSWPLERVAIMGAVDWGPMRGWLPKIHFPKGVQETRPTRTMLAELKLFDMWIWHAHCNRGVVQRVEQIEAACGIGEPDTHFFGYWENAKHVRVAHADVKSSFYVRPGKVALLYVTNFSRNQAQVSLDLDFSDFDLQGPVARDAENGKALPMTGATAVVQIPWHDFRMIKLTPQ